MIDDEGFSESTNVIMKTKASISPLLHWELLVAALRVLPRNRIVSGKQQIYLVFVVLIFMMIGPKLLFMIPHEINCVVGK